jgi:hypothetical protein
VHFDYQHDATCLWRAQSSIGYKNQLQAAKNGFLIKVFSGSLTPYKQKDDPVIIASALELPTEGKIGDLYKRIKAHLDENLLLAEITRFVGLYSRCRTTNNL